MLSTATMTTCRLLSRVVAPTMAGGDALFRHVASGYSCVGIPPTATTRLFFSTTTSGTNTAVTEDSNDAVEEKAPRPSFDAVKSAIYQKIAANHRHRQGPWPKMVQAVQALMTTNHLNKNNFTVLDLATGPGEPAASIAATFPQAHVIGTDISPDQVALAQKNPAVLQQSNNLEICQADMENLTHQFDENQFDIVTCCYGFMFPPNINQAIAETYRVLKPGGNLVATTWNKVLMMDLTKDMLGQAFGPSNVPSPPMNPLSLQEPGLFERMLEQGGFHAIDSTPVTYPFDFGHDADFYFQAFFMLQSDFINAQDNGWDRVRRVFDQEYTKWGTIDASTGNFILQGNEYKLTIAKK